mmetsp:Transcript_74654/g.242606  ORF Transcript_74654/g.242606 Transcript_74654/m.242606 type:complete len:170 (+) Transcript_74654:61-570(+)
MRIYALPPMGGRSRRRPVTTPPHRNRMELSVRADDPTQEMLSAASTFFPFGTHRSGQCKEASRTPGPGTYRATTCFPDPRSDSIGAHCSKKRSFSHRFTSRQTTRVVDIGNPFAIVPPAVSLTRGVDARDLPTLGRSGWTVNQMPPCNSSPVILKGHGGDVPKGFGPPY